MGKENYWTKFCEDTNQSMADIIDDFREEEQTFVDRILNVEVKQESDEKSLKDKKNAALALVEDSKKDELSQKIDEMLNCIRERDERIKQLKTDTEKNKATLGDWYNKAKQHSKKLCDELRKYTNEESGVLNIVAYILEEVVSKEGLKMNEAITKVKGIISSRKRSRFGKIVLYVLLIVIVLAVMAVLYVMIGTDKVLCGIHPTDLGKWIAVGFILVFQVGTVFLIIRICSLIKKRNREIRQLQLLLDKMGIHNMTKHEIDRELERIQETVEK